MKEEVVKDVDEECVEQLIIIHRFGNFRIHDTDRVRAVTVLISQAQQ